MKPLDFAYMARTADIIFYPALTPLEAAMLPAAKPRAFGALAHVRAAFYPGMPERAARFGNRLSQRQKIWVRYT